MSETTSTDITALIEVDGRLPVPSEQPLLVAEGLGLRGGRGWVYRDIALRVPPGGLAAVAGPAGSGRTMLLLTLAGRAKPKTGLLTVAGDTAVRSIRRAVAVARITGAAELEPDLRVRDHAHELRSLLGRGVDFAAARSTVGLTAPDDALVADLDTVQATLLAVTLAVAAGPRAVVLDDLDRDTTPAQTDTLWAALRDLTQFDIAVIASCTDPGPAEAHGAEVLHLPAPGDRDAGPVERPDEPAGEPAPAGDHSDEQSADEWPDEQPEELR
jgi:ABC-2 type transport system ATP-binding protein